MSLAHAPRQYTGVRAFNPPTLQLATRAPTSSDTQYVKGTLWMDTTGLASYQWPGSGSWIALGTGAVGGVVTLTGGSGGAISPAAGNITLAGTANQITTTGAGSTITWSLPAALVAPGSITATTSIASTTTMTAGTGLTATTGNIVATAGQVNAGTSMTAATSITATAGDITATLGNVIINGAAKQLRVHGGAATDFIGQTTLVAGTIEVLNTNIAATDKVFPSRVSVNGSTAIGSFLVTITPATKFAITALKSDATTETNDVSVVDYFIVRQV